MNTRIGILVAAAWLGGSILWSLYAGSPPVEQGHVLLLKNERTVVGDIRLEGGQYRVRRETGEMLVDATKVLCLCSSHEEALANLRRMANLGDPDERLRLARWCQVHGMKEKALEEVAASLAIRPDDEGAVRLKRGLERGLADASAPPSNPEEVPASPPPAELTNESLAAFATKVQPILMNTCLSCHVNRTNGFKLIRNEGLSNRRALNINVQAVVSQVQKDSWSASPFLIKAVTTHGDATAPPLKGKQSAPYKALEEWVKSYAEGANNGTPAKETKTAVVTSAVTTPLPGTTVGKPLAALRPEETSFASPAPVETGTPANETPPAPAPPAGTPAPEKPPPPDPFDPAIFNRNAQSPRTPAP